MMFIKCRIKNYSDTAKRIRASVPATGHYMKDGRYAYKGDNTYFTCSKRRSLIRMSFSSIREKR